MTRRRAQLSSLQTTFAVSFAAVAAGVTVLVGFLSYDAAARLVRVDQQSAFAEVVGDLQDEVRHNTMTPQDFSSSEPGHDIVRPSRTDVQVLGAGERSSTAAARRCPSPPRTAVSPRPRSPG